jgi:predicted helicase
LLAFLPQKNIHKTSNATIKLLENNNVIPDFIIVSINSKITNDPVKIIEDARLKARIMGKKGVLVLSGRQCSLGVSIKLCDIVLLLNNNTGFDLIYQMMFRCMTEEPGKKCGFVIDLNIHRVIETSIQYATLIQPNKHPRDATKYLLQERLINLNGDHWMQCFGKTAKVPSLQYIVYIHLIKYTKHLIDRF